MYEIIFKVPKGVQGLIPGEVFRKVQKLIPKAGEIFLENDYCLYFGLRQDNDDISAFEAIFPPPVFTGGYSRRLYLDPPD